MQGNGDEFFSPGGPNFSLINQYGHWAVSIRGSSNCLERCEIETAVIQFVAKVVPGSWVDFVYHTRLTHHTSGFGRLYMNGIEVWSQDKLRTAYKSPWGVFVKWGVYKHQW